MWQVLETDKTVVCSRVALVEKAVQEMQAARGELLVHQTAVTVQTEAEVEVLHTLSLRVQAQ
jgi:hypothetical protein